LNRLADEIEGICGPNGFVLPGTTRFISRSAPYLDKNENGGITRVLVRYETDVVFLERGDTVVVRVDNVNRLGAMTTYTEDDIAIASILLPNDLQDEGTPEEMFHRDHVITVQILDLRYGIGWDKITAVGKVVCVKEPDAIDEITNEIGNGYTGVKDETVSSEW
jgi:sporulation protein YlmC with PRC-barrel domain